MPRLNDSTFKTSNKMAFMHHGAKRITFNRAQRLRRTETEAEKILWEKLRLKQLGVKFRRQHPIHCFIADFYCHELKLVIEVDGSIHLQEENIRYDQMRTAVINEFGIRVERFTNDQIFFNMDQVIGSLKAIIAEILNKQNASAPLLHHQQTPEHGLAVRQLRRCATIG